MQCSRQIMLPAGGQKEALRLQGTEHITPLAHSSEGIPLMHALVALPELQHICINLIQNQWLSPLLLQGLQHICINLITNQWLSPLLLHGVQVLNLPGLLHGLQVLNLPGPCNHKCH